VWRVVGVALCRDPASEEGCDVSRNREVELQEAADQEYDMRVAAQRDRDDWRGRAERVMAERDHLVAIVRDLAACDGPYDWEFDGCLLCEASVHPIEESSDPARHAESCPWRRAREWTETHP